MPLNVADRVRDTTTTTGTGTITLSGTSPTGYQTFSAVGNGNTTYYTINAGAQWEVGIGTYSGAGPSLSRDTVLASSNSGSLVDFAAGTKDVFCDYPASKSISDGFGLLPVPNGGTGVTTLTGYVKGSGTSPLTASATIPVADVVGAAASGANTDITALDQDVTITATGTIAADTIGYRGLPQNSQTASYTLALTDIGKTISITTGGVVIPANGSVAFPIGATIVVFNNSGSTQTISITTDTLRLAGTATTGSRTLAAYGLATLVKVTSTVWVATGNVT